MNQSMLPIHSQEEPDFNPYEHVEVGIEFITPSYAAELQANNYEFNRDLIKANVNDLKKMMVDGNFVLSNDAVVIDGDGVMKNAQHRMEAVIQSGIGQWFVVMRNVTHDMGSIIDTGRSRKMADRISFSGTKISRKQCSIVRHAMCDIQSPTTGVMQFSKAWQDDIVKDTFRRFQDYFAFLDSQKFTTTTYNPLALGAGLKIWAHMKGEECDYAHGMTAEERVTHWIEIVTYGTPSTLNYVPSLDGAAAKVFAARREKKEESPGAGFWNDAPSLRKSVNGAFKFMNCETIGRNFYAVTNDPFKPLRKMPPTNPKYIVPEYITPQKLSEFILED